MIIASDQEQQAVLQPENETPESAGTVLVVDDEREMRQVLRDSLEYGGFRVLEADCGEEALAVMRQRAGEVDLVITDGVMAGMGGRELLWRLAERYPELPVIFSSGILPQELALGDMEVQPAAYVPKPFDPRALLVVVRGVLEG